MTAPNSSCSGLSSTSCAQADGQSGCPYLRTAHADPAGYDPDRMSFIQGVRVVRRQVTDQAAIIP